MKKVTIYSTRICPYCVRAKNFFQKKDIAYEDIMVDMDQEQLRIMMEKSKDNQSLRSLLAIIMLEVLMI